MTRTGIDPYVPRGPPREIRCPDCKKVVRRKALKLLGSRHYCPHCDVYLGTTKGLRRFKA